MLKGKKKDKSNLPNNSTKIKNNLMIIKDFSKNKIQLENNTMMNNVINNVSLK